MPKFSFMVPVYNKEGYLVKCIESLTGQTYGDFEVVIVDDHSMGDNSYTLARMLAKKDPRIKVHRNRRNLGIGQTRNELLKKAKGRYLIFVDPDDYVERELLERINEVLVEDLDIVRFQNIAEPATPEQAEIEATKNPYRFSCEPTPTISGEEAFVKWMFGVNKLNTMPWTYCVRREFYSGIQYPDMPVLEDFPVTPYLVASAKRVRAIDYMGYHYMQYNDSLTKAGRTPHERVRFRREKLRHLFKAVCVTTELLKNTPISEDVKSDFFEDLTARLKDKFMKFETARTESSQYEQWSPYGRK